MSRDPVPAVEEAFVIRFRPGPAPNGRIEHVATGDAARFASFDDMVAFIRRLLADGAVVMKIALLAAALAFAPDAEARKAKPTPCTGTYVVSGAPLAGTTAPDALVVGTTVASASGCPAAKAKLKANKKGTQVTARWSSCPGVTGKAILKAKIGADCATLTGSFRAKKSRIKRSVTATRSTCGDGYVDVSAETCDGATGCAAGQLCGPSCACGGGPTCGPNAPQVAFTTGGTATAGQAVTFDASATTDADGDPLVLAWSFGDGSRGGGAKVAHVYTTAGAMTVRLTASDACGNATTLDQAITIAAGPSPTNTTTAQGRVLDVNGAPIAGAEVRAEPGGTATSNASGDVSVTVGQGVPVRITVAKTGYAEQVVLTEVPDLPNPDAYFEATLLARQPAQALDATAGGTVGGAEGAIVSLPAGALVDGDGNPVTGAVDAFVTPVDVVERVQAFPGRAEGLSPDGTQGPIVTYGTVEYAFEKDGAALNLEPGTAATIEIPIYAGKTLNGAPVVIGQTHPLWALDPKTGSWVQEGEGTVVASATSPSGLALRGQVTHFSFWNCDDPQPPWYPKPKCLVDTNADGILEDLTGTGHCWHGGTGPEQPDDGFGAFAVPAQSFPNWIGQVVLPAAGGQIVTMPAQMDLVLKSRAMGGLLRGTTEIRGEPFVEEDVIVVLEPVDVDSQHITIPFETTRTLTDEDSLHVYDFDGTAGQTVFVTVDDPGISVTAADVSIVLPDDDVLGPVEYRPIVEDPGRIGLLLPVTGNYRIVVDRAPAAADGDYHMVVDHTGDFPIVLSTTPASNATGVATSTSLDVTFSQTVDEALTVTVFQAESPIGGTTGVAGAVATFTPDDALIPGASYRVRVSGFRSPGEVEPNGFPNPHVWSFNVAETAGTLVPVGPGRSASPQIAAHADGTMHTIWQRAVPSTSNHETWVATYTPGVGWSPPKRFFDGAKVGGSIGTSVAITPEGALAVWIDPSPAPSFFSLYESRWTAATGWSVPQLIEDSAINFDQPPALGVDDDGNAIATFGTSAPAGQGDTYWMRYTAGGTWTAPAVLLDDVRRQSLAVGPTGHAIAAAESLATSEARVRRFTPGQGWSAVETFETMEVAHLAVDGSGNLFLLIMTDSLQYVVRRFDQGMQTWSAPLTVQTSSSCSTEARIVAADDGSAFIVGCTAVAPGPGVVAVRYAPGTGWGTPELLAANPATIPDVGVDAAGDAVAAWITGNDLAGHYKRYTVGSGWEATIHDVPGPTSFGDRRLGVGGNGVAVLVYGPPLANQPVTAVRLP